MTSTILAGIKLWNKEPMPGFHEARHSLHFFHSNLLLMKDPNLFFYYFCVSFTLYFCARSLFYNLCEITCLLFLLTQWFFAQHCRRCAANISNCFRLHTWFLTKCFSPSHITHVGPRGTTNASTMNIFCGTVNKMPT